MDAGGPVPGLSPLRPGAAVGLEGLAARIEEEIGEQTRPEGSEESPESIG
jgi:hypothetical protein